MTNDLVDSLFKLLQSENIDVSYFAAGIVAHLTSDGEQAWKACKVNELSYVITNINNKVIFFR